MVGVVEAFGPFLSPAPRRAAHQQPARCKRNGNERTWLIVDTPIYCRTRTQWLAGSRDDPMKRPIPTTASPRIHIHPCSIVASQSRPRRTDQQEGALPFVSFFCSTTRAQFSPLRCHSASAPALFPGLKFSPTLGSGTQSALHDDTHARHKRTKNLETVRSSGSRSAVYGFPQSSDFCLRIVATTIATVRSKARRASSLLRRLFSPCLDSIPWNP